MTTAVALTTPAAVRSSLAQALRDEAAVMFPAESWNVYEEAPDALVPPGFVVSWEQSSPQGDQWGVWVYRLSVECWPVTDLTAAGWVPSRDQLLEVALSVVGGAWVPSGIALQGWDSSSADRQLGGQPYRVAVVLVQLLVPAPC